MRYLKLLLAGFCLAFPLSLSLGMQAQAQGQNSFGIAATVNKDAISQSDVDDRLKLIFASSGIADTPENRNKTRPQAINILIDEQLKIQEAAKNNLAVTDAEIDKAFSDMAARNKMSAEDFEKVTVNSGIPAQTLRQQIKAQIAWSKVVGSVLRPRIDVTENDINAKMDRLKENIGQTEYQVSEIFLPVETSQDDAKIKELGSKLIEEMKNGRAPFPTVAAQFSKTASASQGGSIGWVQEGDLPKELDLVVKSLTKGQISPPVKSLSGYYILALTDKRQISEETLPSDDDVLSSIGLQRLERLQKRYLADIKSASFIDRRN